MTRAQLRGAVRDLHKLLDESTTAGATGAQLLARFVVRNDEAAFAEIVRLHGRLVLGVCRRVLQQEQDAEDAFQATFLILARKAPGILKQQSLAGWLYGVALRTAQNARRIAMRRQKHERRSAAAAAEPAAVTTAAFRELQSLLDEEVGRLPERYRTPFVLCCLEGKDRAEAAVALGWKEGTVSSRLARARELLAQRLARRGVAVPAALAALMLSQPVASAALSAATVRAALAFANGHAAEALSAAATGLARQVLRGMVLNRATAVVAFVVGLCLLAAGAALTASQSAEAPPGPQPPEARQPAADRPGAAKGPAQADLPAAPLPRGAVARFGTLRFRPGDGVESLDWSPDGKRLATVCWNRPEGVCVWDAATGRLLHRLTGKHYHGSAFSPDGKDLAVAGWNEVLVYDLATGRQKLQFPAGRATELVAYSPDGKILAAWSIDTEFGRPEPVSGKTVVTLHDAGTGKLLRRLERTHDSAVVGNTARSMTGDSSVIKFVAFALDGRAVLAAGWDRGVCVWDAQTGAKLHLIGGRQQQAYRFAVAPDGKIVAAAGLDGRLRLYEVTTGREIVQVPATGGKNSRLAGLTFAPGGKLLASAAMVGEGEEWFGHVDLWEIPSGRRVGQVSPCAAAPLAFSPDGGTLATVGGAVRLWDVKTGRLSRPDGGPHAEAIGLAFLPDGRTLISQGRDGAIRWWDVKRSTQVRQVPCVPTTPSNCLALSPDGRLLAYGRGHPWAVALLDAATGKELRRLSGNKEEVATLAFSSDGKRLVTTGHTGKSTVWDVETGRPVGKLGHSGGLIVLSSDGALLAVSRSTYETPQRHNIDVYDTATGQRVQTMPWTEKEAAGSGGGSGPGVFTPDRKKLVLGTAAGDVLVMDLATGKAERRFRVADCLLWLLVVAPDGKTLAVAPYPSRQREVGVWDLPSGKRLAVFPSNGFQTTSLAFSPDSRWLAAGGPDTTITVWDVSRRRP